jgi:hypothetical protein
MLRGVTTPRPLAAATGVLLAAAAVFTACGGENTNAASSSTSSSGSPSGAGGTGGGSASGGAGGVDVPPPPMRKKISGDLTWQVTFDDAAKTAGATDCSYARHYEGFEDRSAPWLCPTCTITFLVDAQVSTGLADCFSQVSTTSPAKVEWLGYDADGKFLRGLGAAMTEQGTATQTATGFDMANMVPDLDATVGGKMSFSVSGQLAVGDDLGDALNGFTPPATYACGWPKADAPAYAGDYVLAKGATVPDGIFKDKCDEPVRLHELAGAYLFVEMSARDCGPCQQMATGEEQFIADLKAKGIDVRVVTLLCPSLSDTAGDTTKAMLAAWTKTFKLASPVLADRGWGLSVLAPAIGETMVGYPSWALVDPQLKVLDFGSGFGTWTEIETAILADAMP